MEQLEELEKYVNWLANQKEMKMYEMFDSIFLRIYEIKNRIDSVSVLYIGQKVYHSQIYKGLEEMTIVGIRRNEVELLGDYSGGTHNIPQQSWMPLNGLSFNKNTNY